MRIVGPWKPFQKVSLANINHSVASGCGTTEPEDCSDPAS
jgi:hypothetical protein